MLSSLFLMLIQCCSLTLFFRILFIACQLVCQRAFIPRRVPATSHWYGPQRPGDAHMAESFHMANTPWYHFNQLSVLRLRLIIFVNTIAYYSYSKDSSSTTILYRPRPNKNKLRQNNDKSLAYRHTSGGVKTRDVSTT